MAGKTPEMPSAFSPVSKKTWVERLAADARGAPLEALRRRGLDGVVREPLYAPEDAPATAQPSPGIAPYTRGARPVTRR